MRNFIQVAAKTWVLTLVDTNFPFDTVDLPGVALAGTIDELQAQVDGYNNLLLAGWPGYVIQTNGADDKPADNVYMMLDKDNVVAFLQYQTQAGGLSNYASLPMFIVNPTESPRYTGWSGIDGEKHPSAPSDRGVPAPKGSGSTFKFVSLAKYLSQIYAIFVVLPNPTRQLRQLLQDLLTAINLANSGKITQAQIDKIFAELAQFGL